MSVKCAPTEHLLRLSERLAAEYTRLSGFLNIHGGKVPNLHILERIGQHGASIPTIVGAAVRSYAQYGEDVIVKALLQARAPDRYREKKIFYLDIGANHPINISNTWLFYEEGMKGVVVEPNPALHGELARLRPRDVLIRGVVAAGNSAEADFFVPHRHELASLSREFIRHYHKQHTLADDQVEHLRVDTFDINEIIRNNCIGGVVDFLNIDVEGMDFEILQCMNFAQCRPLVICIEPSTGIAGSGLDDNDRRIQEHLSAHGYILTGATPANMIYVDGRSAP